MHVLYIFALRCPALKKGCCIDRLNGCTFCTFLLFAALQADKSLRLLAFLQNTLRSAADRINNSNFRGRCGTVIYHTVLNL